MNDSIRDAIEDIFTCRLDKNERKFGPWPRPYQRQFTKEIIDELVDVPIYALAMVLQWDGTMRLLDGVVQRAAARIALGEDPVGATRVEVFLLEESLVEELARVAAGEKG